MNDEKLKPKPSLSEQVVDVLERHIQEGRYAIGSQLPSESELASTFGVSRATVRSALSALASTGRIIRRQGLGTYVGRLSLISNPVNKVMEFEELISSGGLEPGVSVMGAELILAEDEDVANLSVEKGSQLLRVRKVFTGDGAPLIYVNSYLPEWIMADQLDQLLEKPELTEPLFGFIEQGCGHRVANMVATFWPETVHGCITEAVVDISGHPPHTPVLRMNYVAYSDDDTPLFKSHQAYLGRMMRFTLLRHRLYQA
jgi:GntR family transcriptional regulator